MAKSEISELLIHLRGAYLSAKLHLVGISHMWITKSSYTQTTKVDAAGAPLLTFQSGLCRSWWILQIGHTKVDKQFRNLGFV